MIVDEITILDERWQRLQSNYQALLSILPKIALKTFILTEERPPERLAGQHAIHQTLEELVAHSKQEILAFLPPPSDAVCTALAGRMLNLAVRQPGVHTRAIYTDATITVALGVPRPAQLAAAGIEIRIAADLPLNLIIVDRAVAVLPVEAAHPDRGARLIRDSCTITALIALFESFWVTGQSFSPDEIQVEECGALDRAILRQLATGNKDDAVARQLGISVRTLRRRIADLMQQVNAQSRFELAIEAATRGWVDSAAVR
jgi:DNA-binding CsgD family transcriptional regulator